MSAPEAKTEALKELLAANRDTLAASPADFEDYDEYNLAMAEARHNIAQFRSELADLGGVA